MQGGREGEALARKILALPRPLLLAWDVDGTLAPIVDDPGLALVPDGVQSGLRKLVGTPGICIAFITGRDLDGLSRMLDVPGAYLAVEHGGIILSPGLRHELPALASADEERLRAFELWARDAALDQGAELEVKRSSRGLHVRKLSQRDPELAGLLLQQAEEVAVDLGLVPRRGRAVLEAELFRGDKGAALQKIVTMSSARGVCFAGDDFTDVPAIERAVALGGLGMFVGSAERSCAPAIASGELDGCDEVARLVAALVGATSSAGGERLS